MGQFLTELDSIPVGEIGRFWNRRTIWMLQSPLEYRTDRGELIVVPTGFQHDFCSVPRWVPIIYSLWGDTAHREGVLHDYLFRRDSKPVVKFRYANSIFKEAAISRKKTRGEYYPMYLGVMLGGIFSFHKLPVDHQFFPVYDFA